MDTDTDDYDAQAERIKQRAAEHKQQQDEQHDALLEAAAADEDLVVEEHDTANIGDATLTVKTEIPGEVMRKLDVIYDGDLSPGETLDVYVDVLASQTVRVEAGDVVLEDPGDVESFYRRFIDEHDAERAAALCLERVVEQPNRLEQERRQDVVQSFPATKRELDGRGVGGGGPRSE